MKLRCSTNSIRLRLRRSEVESLLQAGQVADAVHFGSGEPFRFVLELVQDQTEIEARRDPAGLTVLLPQDLGQQWVQSDMVGLEGNQPIGKDQSLHILVEKDFPCVTRPGEDRSDFFGELQQEDNLAC